MYWLTGGPAARSETGGGAAADFAVTAYWNQHALGLPVGTGASDRDFGYPLHPSRLAVERDLKLSTQVSDTRDDDIAISRSLTLVQAVFGFWTEKSGKNPEKIGFGRVFSAVPEKIPYFRPKPEHCW